MPQPTTALAIRLHCLGAAAARATAAVVVVVAVCAPGAGAASLPPGPSTEILRPADARLTASLGSHALPDELVHASGLACSPASACVAVGRYLDAATPATHAMAASESGGVWERAVRITPPPDVPESADARLDAVACPAPGSCVAIGSTGGTPMAVSQSAGVWGRAVRLPGPAYSSLACDAAGSCVALGVSAAGLAAVSRTAGTWGSVTEIAMPPDALSSQATLAGVACTVARCVAVGDYPVAGGATRPFAVSETGGTWSAAQAVPPGPGIPANLTVKLSSVACPAADPCVAVGAVTTSAGNAVPVAATAVAGVFGPAAVIAPPAGRAAASNGLASVGCSAIGRCAAVGTSAVDPGQPNPGLNYPLAVTGSGGTWAPASLVARMPDAASPFGIAQLRRAACDGSGSCMAIGRYRSVASRDETMAVSESGGTVGRPDARHGATALRGRRHRLRGSARVSRDRSLRRGRHVQAAATAARISCPPGAPRRR